MAGELRFCCRTTTSCQKSSEIAIVQIQQTTHTESHSMEYFVCASLELHGLDLSVGDRDAILVNAKAIADAYAIVCSFLLPDELDTAPVFKA